MEQPTWVGEIVDRVARAVRDARGRHSAQWLADRTAELGHPISRAAITNLENGRKTGVDVAELLVLAAALKVPPAALLYPNVPDGPVEVLPGQIVTSLDAVQWFSGEELLDERDGEASHGRQPLALSRARLATRRLIETASHEALSATGFWRDNPELLQQQIAAYREQLNELERQLRDLGMHVAGGRHGK